ncbi:3' exoribonuclease family 1 containing protein (macronuclear) [Tetrahymena thermophila SB210]|uniref:3' exoribonuclease family 1 containing protein n=1 Tax=Tetrahymena thermophila (strain SB210) TaxID=312017 RepID=I7MB69_TETTS|nr:3' exoribonuclease family 1 containing protein [Tetrahymena thermophila SB210]EAS07760.1 3' exoribonuclease family 1 containing protein [Tetrahymena thermophila SB210]|eukprot:XP_001028002.1 3' exoribonuclease family 1 containing protein [Tetrahymena thermophila SB210]
MEIEEEEKIQKNETQIAIKRQKYPKSESDKIVKANMNRYKKKKQVQVLVHPNIPCSVMNLNQEPIYIYFLFKIFKSYDNEDYNKHRYFGYADAGVGRIDQIYLDKVNETIDLNLQIYSQGYEDYKYLIQIFKNKQDILYYNLANLLEQYQQWTNQHLSYILNAFSDKNIFNQSFQEKIDQAQPEFESVVKKWAQEKFPNELFEIELGTVNINQAKPILLKKIFSQGLMMLLGGEVYDIYQKLIEYNLKESLSSFLNGGEYNGRLQLEKIIILIKSFMQNNYTHVVFEDEIFTLDGISIPTKKTIKTYYYDEEQKQINQKPNMYFIIITFYNFESNWIKYLIEIRQQFSQLRKEIEYPGIKEASQKQFYKNFEYICKQEYFLEKFDYTNKFQDSQ